MAAAPADRSGVVHADGSIGTRYSGDWWKVQQEEAHALREEQALRRRASGRLRRVQTGAAQDGGKESALNAPRSPNAIAVPEGPPLIVAKLGEQFCTDADGSTSAATTGWLRVSVGERLLILPPGRATRKLLVPGVPCYFAEV